MSAILCQHCKISTKSWIISSFHHHPSSPTPVPPSDRLWLLPDLDLCHHLLSSFEKLVTSPKSTFCLETIEAVLSVLLELWIFLILPKKTHSSFVTEKHIWYWETLNELLLCWFKLNYACHTAFKTPGMAHQIDWIRSNGQTGDIL